MSTVDDSNLTIRRLSMSFAMISFVRSYQFHIYKAKWIVWSWKAYPHQHPFASDNVLNSFSRWRLHWLLVVTEKLFSTSNRLEQSSTCQFCFGPFPIDTGLSGREGARWGALLAALITQLFPSLLIDLFNISKVVVGWMRVLWCVFRKYLPPSREIMKFMATCDNFISFRARLSNAPAVASADAWNATALRHIECLCRLKFDLNCCCKWGWRGAALQEIRTKDVDANWNN